MATSEKKILANQRNSKHSTGPRSAAGKRHSGRNAWKHGLFSSELFLTDQERPEFEELSNSLRGQFAPATPMQEIAFERVAVGCWRCRLATRLEMTYLKAHFDLNQADENGGDLPSHDRPPSKWYGSSRSDLQDARKYLTWLRDDVRANSFCHQKDWKDPLIKICGNQEFYDCLEQLKPALSVDEILSHVAISEKTRIYDMTVWKGFEPGSEKEQLVAESRSKWEMAVRLIDERKQHLEDLARMNLAPGDDSGERRNGSNVDMITRYLNATTREMERAVRWFQELRAGKL
ncbi:MAG: hypothetical protein ACRD23_00925 [Terriglobales bacterium]